MNKVLGSIAHRGPDGAGVFTDVTQPGDWQIALGHRRLAIIDVANAKQPMQDTAAGLTVVFNGEIYNFRELRQQLVELGCEFRLDSDTEVLLKGYRVWGTAIVERLRGMFAFAIWDHRNRELFLARDRFGKKPLFVHHSNGDIFFASEIKALLQIPGIASDPDNDAIRLYLIYRYVPSPRTLFREIKKFPPGNWLLWSNGKITQHEYFRPQDRCEIDQRLETTDVVPQFLQRFEEAVKLRLVSDVPFGAFLSGGIDSSAIVAIMSRHLAVPVKTYSVGFAEQAYTETSYARLIANQFGTDHHELMVKPNEIIDNLPELVRLRDAPSSEPADAPLFLLSKQASRSVKMVLSGEGADEILAGYPKHAAERFVGTYQRLPAIVRHGLLEPLLRSLPYGFRRAKTVSATIALDDWRERAVRWFGAMSESECNNLMLSGINGHQYWQEGIQFDVEHGNTPLRKLLYFDQTSWLPDNLLERGDRMSMGASIEVRMPFMDHELVHFVSQLPDRYKIRGSRTKWLLYKSMENILPQAILKRPKVGFRMPVADWFRSSMREFVLDHISTPSTQIRKYCKRDVLDRLVNEHMTGKRNHEKLLWALLNLEIWHRTYQ